MPKYNQGVMNILHLLPEEVRETVNRERVGSILGSLSEKESRALELRFGLYDGSVYSYEAIGEKLGMSSMGAMKLFKRVVKKLVDGDGSRV
jgi:DNA-directed RNA polymerase sigma subunit (sigma70/sigma32)